MSRTTWVLVVGAALAGCSGGSNGDAGRDAIASDLGSDTISDSVDEADISRGDIATTDGSGDDAVDVPVDSVACTRQITLAPAPAVLAVVVDRSGSMSAGGKWSTLQTALVEALDRDAFDGLTVGLVDFPNTSTSPPQCIVDAYCGGSASMCMSLFPSGLACGVTALPSVALANAGTDKSTASSGVRHDIGQYVAAHNPLSNDMDGAPFYDALVSAYGAVQSAVSSSSLSRAGLVAITDGSFNCTSLSSPARPGYSDGTCPDWEQPDTLLSLVESHRSGAVSIRTSFIGVPGSASHGETIGAFQTAPYSMRLALSTLAVAGASDAVDPTCDSPAMFTMSGSDPAHPCHFDLSNGSSFDAASLGNAIADARRTVLGCVYRLPTADVPASVAVDADSMHFDLSSCGAGSCFTATGSDLHLTGPVCDAVSRATRVVVTATSCP